MFKKPNKCSEKVYLQNEKTCNVKIEETNLHCHSSINWCRKYLQHAGNCLYCSKCSTGKPPVPLFIYISNEYFIKIVFKYCLVLFS